MKELLTTNIHIISMLNLVLVGLSLVLASDRKITMALSLFAYCFMIMIGVFSTVDYYSPIFILFISTASISIIQIVPIFFQKMHREKFCQISLVTTSMLFYLMSSFDAFMLFFFFTAIQLVTWSIVNSSHDDKIKNNILIETVIMITLALIISLAMLTNGILSENVIMTRALSVASFLFLWKTIGFPPFHHNACEIINLAVREGKGAKYMLLVKIPSIFVALELFGHLGPSVSDYIPLTNVLTVQLLMIILLVFWAWAMSTEEEKEKRNHLLFLVSIVPMLFMLTAPFGKATPAVILAGLLINGFAYVMLVKSKSVIGKERGYYKILLSGGIPFSFNFYLIIGVFLSGQDHLAVNAAMFFGLYLFSLLSGLLHSKKRQVINDR